PLDQRPAHGSGLGAHHEEVVTPREQKLRTVRRPLRPDPAVPGEELPVVPVGIDREHRPPAARGTVGVNDAPVPVGNRARCLRRRRSAIAGTRDQRNERGREQDTRQSASPDNQTVGTCPGYNASLGFAGRKVTTSHRDESTDGKDRAAWWNL